MPIDVVFKSDNPEIYSEAQVYINQSGYFCVMIQGDAGASDYQIALFNKQNAIKFAKEVRKQISFMEEVNHEG